jgi:hypothetical protein
MSPVLAGAGVGEFRPVEIEPETEQKESLFRAEIHAGAPRRYVNQ